MSKCSNCYDCAVCGLGVHESDKAFEELLDTLLLISQGIEAINDEVVYMSDDTGQKFDEARRLLNELLSEELKK